MIEEATEIEIADSLAKGNGLIRGGEANGSVPDTDVKIIPSEESIGRSADEDKQKTESAKTTSSTIQPTSITQTTAPIEDGDYKVYLVSRHLEVDEMNGTAAPWSPQKPPRRASQLLTANAVSATEEAMEEEANVKVNLEPKSQIIQSTDDGIVADMVLSRTADISPEEFVVTPTKGPRGEAKIAAESRLEKEEEGLIKDEKMNEQTSEVPHEGTRSIGTMGKRCKTRPLKFKFHSFPWIRKSKVLYFLF